MHAGDRLKLLFGGETLVTNHADDRAKRPAAEVRLEPHRLDLLEHMVDLIVGRAVFQNQYHVRIREMAGGWGGRLLKETAHHSSRPAKSSRGAVFRVEGPGAPDNGED